MHIMVPSKPSPLAFMFLSAAAEICLCLRGKMNDSLFINPFPFCKSSLSFWMSFPANVAGAVVREGGCR